MSVSEIKTERPDSTNSVKTCEAEIKAGSSNSTDNVKMYVCDLCNDCFSRIESFKIHARKHKNYTCKDCKKVFYMKSHLDKHLLSSNCLVLYHCEICGKEFKQAKYLRYHLYSHSGGKKYEALKKSFERNEL